MTETELYTKLKSIQEKNSKSMENIAESNRKINKNLKTIIAVL